MKLLALVASLFLLATAAHAQGSPEPERDTVIVAKILDARTFVVDRGDTIALLGVKIDPALDDVIGECIGVVDRAEIIIIQDASVVDPSTGAKPRYVFTREGLDLNLTLIQNGCAKAASMELDQRYSRQSTFRQAAIYARPHKRGTTVTETSTTPKSVDAPVEPSGSSNGASSNGASSSVQCSGTTKKGTRCSRMTTAANGRCYQH